MRVQHLDDDGEIILNKYKYIYKYKIQVEIHMYDREYIWVRAQHLDDRGGDNCIQIQIHTHTQIHIHISIQIHMYDREYIWVRAQHLDDGGGGPRLLCSSYPLHCISRCQNCPCYVYLHIHILAWYIHMDSKVTSA